MTTTELLREIVRRVRRDAFRARVRVMRCLRPLGRVQERKAVFEVSGERIVFSTYHCGRCGQTSQAPPPCPYCGAKGVR